MNYGEYFNAAYSDDNSGVNSYDRYSSLSGRNGCSSFSEYQQSGKPYTPSSCNFVDDYAPVAQEYSATQIPVMAALQYYPWNNVLQVNDGKIYAPKIVDVQGQVAVPKKGGMNVQADEFNSMLQQYTNGAFDDRISVLQAKYDALSKQASSPQNTANMKALQDSIATLNAAKMGSAMNIASSSSASAPDVSNKAAQQAQVAVQQLAQAAATPAPAPVAQVQQAAQMASAMIGPNPQAQAAVQALAQAAIAPQAAPVAQVQQAAATATQGVKEGFYFAQKHNTFSR